MKSFIVLVSFVLTLQHRIAAETFYNEELKKTYILKSKSSQSNYRDAYEYCRQQGAQLIKLDTPNEIKWIHDNIMKSYFWLGVQEDTRTPTRWLDGTPIVSKDFKPRWRLGHEQYHNDQNSDCMSLIFDEYEGNFVRWNCGWNASVLCQKNDQQRTETTTTTRRPTTTTQRPITTSLPAMNIEPQETTDHRFQSSNKSYFISGQKMTFDEAQHFCDKRNATLLRIRSDEERYFVASNVNFNNDAIWLAVKSEMGTAPKQWIDGGNISITLIWYFRSEDALCGAYELQDDIFFGQPCEEHSWAVCEMPMDGTEMPRRDEATVDNVTEVITSTVEVVSENTSHLPESTTYPSMIGELWIYDEKYWNIHKIWSSSKLYIRARGLNFDEAQRFCAEQNATLLTMQSSEGLNIWKNYRGTDINWMFMGSLVWVAAKAKVRTVQSKWSTFHNVIWYNDTDTTCNSVCGAFDLSGSELSPTPCGHRLLIDTVCEAPLNADNITKSEASTTAIDETELTTSSKGIGGENIRPLPATITPPCMTGKQRTEVVRNFRWSAKSTLFETSYDTKSYIASDRLMNFEEAQRFCAVHNATLLRIHSDEERQYFEHYKDDNNYHIWLAVKPEVGKKPTQWIDGGAVKWNDYRKDSIILGKTCGVLTPLWRSFLSYPCNMVAGVVCELSCVQRLVKYKFY